MQELFDDLEGLLEDEVQALSEKGEIDRDYLRRLSKKDRLMLYLVSSNGRVARGNSERVQDAERRLGRLEWVVGGITGGVSFVGAWLLEQWLNLLPN